MKKALLFSFVFMLALVTQVWAQNRTVTGRVTDATTGESLAGVTVQLKGTTTAAPTGADGGYSISVPSVGGTLVFSFIGYTNQEIPLGDKATIDVRLLTDAEAIQEVVITGYSISTQQSFTGSAKVVSGEALDRKNVSNVSQALAGEVAGVRVVNTSGQPGTVATVRIRGIGSVNGNRDPLYVVDGVPFNGGLNSINPADIESTTVLKDAAATAIYGSRGANGVIVITTRSGKGQTSFIEADASLGSNMALLPRYSTIKSPEQYIGLAWESVYNEGIFGYDEDGTEWANTYLFDPNFGIDLGYNIWDVADAGELINPTTRMVRPGVARRYNPEDWEDYAFQNSARKEVNLKLGGSAGRTNYYASFGFLDDVGYSINSDFERLSGRLNVSQEVNKWVTAGLNFNYARSETNNGGQSEDSGSIFWFVDNIPSIYPLFMRDAEGQIITDPIFGGSQFDYGAGDAARGFGGLTNAIADATYDVNRNNRDELNGNANLNFTLLEGLAFENRFGVQYYNNKLINRGNKYYGNSASQNGSIFHQRTELFSYNLLNLLRYSKTFGVHTIEALAAHEATSWDQEIATSSGYNLVDPDLLNLTNAVVSNPNSGYTNEYSLESYFGQINYDFDQKYFLSATVRRDGSSRFRKDKWGNFGSVGLAWVISNEDFMSDLDLFKSLKLKASYGLMGDQAGVGFYPGFDLFDVNNLNDQPAFSFDTKGNPDLTWETSKMFQTGVEFELGRFLSGSIDYYVKNTEDLIFERRVGPSQGFALLLVNDGKLRNRGLEFDLTGNFLKTQDYNLGLNINGEIFDNEITEMPLDPVLGIQKPIDIQRPFGWSVGHSIFDYYLREWAGVDPEDGRARWNLVYRDVNNNNQVDSGEGITDLEKYLSDNPDIGEGDLKTTTTKTYSLATQKYVGKSSIPDIRGAVNLFGTFKGVEVNVQMLYSFGGYAYDYVYAGLMHNGRVGSNNWHTDILNRWQSEENPGNGDVPRLSNDLDQDINSSSSRFLTKANYLVLNNVRLGYSIPARLTSKFGVGGLSIWVSGDNLWIKTKRKGLNPSTAEAGSSNETGSLDNYRYSPLSTISAGLRIKI